MKTVSIELPDDVLERAERRAKERGMSLAGEVGNLVDRLSRLEELNGAAHGARAADSRDDVKLQLADLAAECQMPNWDGQGAASVTDDTVHNAKRFVEALPASVRAPSVGIEADGHVTFEWYRNPRWLLSISVAPGSDLYFAGLFGTSDVRGHEVFVNAIPEIILNLIRRVDAA